MSALGRIELIALLGFMGGCGGLNQPDPGEAPAAVSTPTGALPFRFGSILNISTSCASQNAEVEQAVDPIRGYVYEAWMGCQGIGFARSIDGGVTFSNPIPMPGANGSVQHTWDPAVAVGPDGTVYVAFMVATASQWYPVVVASFDNGLTFSQHTSLVPPDPKNWGDRDFIAIGPDGSVYVTWDYGPTRTTLTTACSSTGSCGYKTGELNVVIQKSSDRGKTFSEMVYVSPGFPASGGDSAPLLVEPDGRLSVLYQGYQTDPTTFTLGTAYNYYTSSTDGGNTWSTPIAVGPQAGTMTSTEWWIDGAIGMDAAGNLYATWDTQGTNADGSANDIGWLSYSTDRGQHWSNPVQATADTVNAPHIVQVAGGAAGVAYAAWLSDSDPEGYALYLRAFSIARGWLSDPVRVSSAFGDSSVWPGDTFGISAVSPSSLFLSWGSAVPASGKKSQIFAVPVSVLLK
jgi:hypothetical protein